MLTIEAIRSAGAVSSSATQSSQVTRRVGLDRQCAGRSVAVLWTGVVQELISGTAHAQRVWWCRLRRLPNSLRSALRTVRDATTGR
jgi:hypothetical protein